MCLLIKFHWLRKTGADFIWNKAEFSARYAWVSNEGFPSATVGRRGNEVIGNVGIVFWSGGGVGLVGSRQVDLARQDVVVGIAPGMHGMINEGFPSAIVGRRGTAVVGTVGIFSGYEGEDGLVGSRQVGLTRQDVVVGQLVEKWLFHVVKIRV